MSILKIDELTKSYGSHQVLKKINLDIQNPDIYALIGPNGSGKSTLFNIIANLIKPNAGKVEVLGKSNQDPSIFLETSFLKDNRILYDYLSGYDHLSFIQNIQKLNKNRISEVVEKLDITSYMKKRTADYSLGMKQHLLLAMAMINMPKLMILDEPLNGLDPTSVIKVRKLFKELKENGTTILIASHTLSEIDQLTDQIMFLKDGIIVEEKLNNKENHQYKIRIEKDSLEKVKALSLEAYEGNIEGQVLQVNMKETPISYLLAQLYAHDIVYSDISKKKVGSEERYMEVFMK